MNDLRIQYGALTSMGDKFFLWFVGGPFEDCPGDFEGPFETLEEAKAEAEALAAVEKIVCERS